jgi:hypothetical protein
MTADAAAKASQCSKDMKTPRIECDPGSKPSRHCAVKPDRD